MLLLGFITVSLVHYNFAQPANCVFKDPIVKIGFGTNDQPAIVKLSGLPKYRERIDACPDDGYYSYAQYTSGCFGGNWIDLLEDHTAGDHQGLMLLVNANVNPAVFFVVKIGGLKPNTNYELSAWMINICRNTVGCSTVYPNIDFIVEDNNGKVLSRTAVGQLPMELPGTWRRMSSYFITASDVNSVVIKMMDKSVGGCGNDFALDDISIRPCEIAPPVVVQEKPKPIAKEVTKPVITQAKPETKPIIAEVKPMITEVKKENAAISKPLMQQVTFSAPVPKALETRSNNVVKHIFTDSAEIKIELYDNGIIDGDTVTIYHNNELLVSKKGLSGKPITLKIKVAASQPHHELVMVADNLGSIPPNTSLMVVTANDKRYEIFISSDDKKNAKVVIDLNQ
jgi:hypothetical protein